jgi:hypothetical protein
MANNCFLGNCRNQNFSYWALGRTNTFIKPSTFQAESLVGKKNMFGIRDQRIAAIITLLQAMFIANVSIVSSMFRSANTIISNKQIQNLRS